MSRHLTVKGYGFHPDLPDGRGAGTIEVGSHGIKFSGTNCKFEFPLVNLKVHTGGASTHNIFFSHPNNPDATFYTTDTRVLSHPSLLALKPLERQLAKIGSHKFVKRLFMVAILCCLVLIPVSVYLTLDAVGGMIARQIPVEWEEALGENTVSQYEVKPGFVAPDVVEPILNELVTPLLDSLGETRYQFRFYVAAVDELNAFALPGGYVVINRGLITSADSAEEFLGVVAHELAHVTEQHGVRNVINSAGTFVMINALLGDMSGILALFADAVPFLMSQRYSRGFEAEADELALRLLEDANINPYGIIRFFEKLRAIEAEGGDNNPMLESVGGLLASHPATDDRIAKLKDMLVGSRGPYRDLSVEFASLRRSINE